MQRSCLLCLWRVWTPLFEKMLYFPYSLLFGVGDVVCASSETDTVVCCVSSGAGAFLSSRRKKTNNTQAAATNIRTINTTAADKISCRCFLFFRAVARRFGASRQLWMAVAALVDSCWYSFWFMYMDIFWRVVFAFLGKRIS